MLITEKNTLEEIPSLIIKELRRGTVDYRHPFRFLWLGSTDGKEVGLRTVVLRDLDSENCPWIYADGRSKKLEHFRQLPSASLLFYHPRKQFQLRIDGVPEIHQGSEKARELWSRVEGEARHLYGTVLPPGMAINHPEEGFALQENIDATNFCPISFRPLKMEALQLNKMRHLRAEFYPEGSQWKGSWLVP
jgi:pyridoxamine 5'-phosphate oxidase